MAILSTISHSGSVSSETVDSVGLGGAGAGVDAGAGAGVGVGGAQDAADTDGFHAPALGFMIICCGRKKDVCGLLCVFCSTF